MEGLTKLAPGAENVGITQRPEPRARDGYVVLRVEAAGVCGTDIHIADDEFRPWPPVTMGHEVCGVVVELGADVDASLLGRRVVSETYFSTCGTCDYCRAGRINLCLERRSIGSAVDGAFAPRLLVPARGVHGVPDWLSSAAASMVEPLACVCNCLLDPPRVTAGDQVLVVGPGPIGLLAAQVARNCKGHVHIRGTERDTNRLAKARELGFQTNVAPEELDRVFDVVVECSGAASGIAFCLDHARRGGRYVQIGLTGHDVSVPFDELCFRELTLTSGNASTPTSWLSALELVEQADVQLETLVTAVMPLSDWELAFSTTRSGDGIKIVIDPR